MSPSGSSTVRRRYGIGFCEKGVGIGPDGSGTNLLARAILSADKVDDTTATLVPATTSDALAMLQAGTLDAAFVVASPAAPIVAQYALTPGVGIYNDDLTDAIARRLPFFTSLVLPRGVLDIRANVPPTDTTMVTMAAQQTSAGISTAAAAFPVVVR